MVTPYKIKSGVIAFSVVNNIYLILFLFVWFVRFNPLLFLYKTLYFPKNLYQLGYCISIIIMQI